MCFWPFQSTGLKTRNDQRARLFLYPEEGVDANPRKDCSHVQWFADKPIGVNTIQTFVKKMCDWAGIDIVGRRIAYTSIREYLINVLKSNKVSDQNVCGFTGHENVSSLANYDSLNPEKCALYTGYLFATKINHSLQSPPPVTTAASRSKSPASPKRIFCKCSRSFKWAREVRCEHREPEKVSKSNYDQGRGQEKKVETQSI